jgi:hypothetical protein
MNNPNSFDETVQDATANPETNDEGTEETETPTTPEPTGIDYEAKFKHSAREAQRLYEEKKALEARIAALTTNRQAEDLTTNPTDELMPGFNALDDDAQRSLLAYTETVKRKAIEEVYKDPDLQYIKTEIKEKRWNQAFDSVSSELPELKEHAIDFRAKYYSPNVNPDPLILKELAKSFLYDKKDFLTKEVLAEQRVNLEEIGGGDKTPQHSARSLEDWDRLRRENPSKFASLSKEFNEDLRRM